MEKRIISWGQLLLLLFMCRVFTLMTFVPFSEQDSTLSVRLTAAAVASAIQAVILIPAVLLRDSSTSVLLNRCRPVGVIAVILYLAFFLFYTANSLLHFRSFLSSRFFPTADSTLWTAVILIVCVYCGCLGIEALGRAAIPVFWLFIAAMIMMVFSAAENFSTANFYLSPVTPQSLFDEVSSELARNGEICAAVFLAKHVREKLRCGVYGLLASKLLLAEAVLLTVCLVLGDFAMLTDYPLLSLGTFGGTRFLQRGDSLYLIVWTITAVLNISLFLRISAGLLEEVLPKLKFRTSITAALVFGITLVPSLTALDFPKLYNALCSGYSVIFLTGTIPTLALLLQKKKQEKKAENKL